MTTPGANRRADCGCGNGRCTTGLSHEGGSCRGSGVGCVDTSLEIAETMSFPDEDIDYREHPEAYEYTPNERGVFKVEPYKSELLPLWSFKTPDAARASVEAICDKFAEYKDADDFVGMDMARKYLRMGFTRAMRYAKYPGGRKYDDDGVQREPQTWADAQKRESAVVFKQAWDAVREDPAYVDAKARHRAGDESES